VSSEGVSTTRERNEKYTYLFFLLTAKLISVVVIVVTLALFSFFILLPLGFTVKVVLDKVGVLAKETSSIDVLASLGPGT